MLNRVTPSLSRGCSKIISRVGCGGEISGKELRGLVEIGKRMIVGQVEGFPIFVDPTYLPTYPTYLPTIFVDPLFCKPIQSIFADLVLTVAPVDPLAQRPTLLRVRAPGRHLPGDVATHLCTNFCMQR